MMEAPQKHKVVGPVDFVVLRFPGNKFNGKIAPELRNLEDNGIVRVIDLILIRKDEEGNVESFEIADLEGEVGQAFQNLIGRTGAWFSQNDVEIIGEELPNNSSAGALLFENLWAIKFKEAILDSGGELVAQGRIPPEQLDMVMEMTSPSRTEE
jgi:Family of unknown function (DUF6325)